MVDYPTYLPLFVALVAGGFALLGAFVGATLTARFALRNQLRLATVQARQQAYASIMGKKFLLSQLYVSRFEAYIFSDYHERLWHAAGTPRPSMDLDEAIRWMHKSEEQALEIARANDALFQSVGLARASFPCSTELDQLIERVYHFNTPLVHRPLQMTNPEELRNWKEQAVSALQKVVKAEISGPIENLLAYLSGRIDV